MGMKKEESLAVIETRAIMQAAFLDWMREALHLENDAGLCKVVHVGAPVVSRWRAGYLAIGATHIIRFHELTEIPVRTIKERLNQSSLKPIIHGKIGE